MTNKTLAAFTPTRQQTFYNYYPPFINFAQQGGFVRIMVRGHEVLNADGTPQNSPMAEMTMDAKCFENLLLEALNNLKAD